MNMNNQDTLKAAARRMCEHLGHKGVNVKHTQMLEAVAVGMGLDSWRELKAVIDAPRSAPVKEVPPGLPRTWVVCAVYEDNRQAYEREFTGRTALEAAIDATVERLTDFGNVILVNAVFDKAAGGPTALFDDLTLLENRQALARLVKAVNPVGGGQVHEALQWLTAVLAEFSADDFSQLTDWAAWGDAGKDEAPIHAGSTMTPAVALELMCEYAERLAGGVLAMERADEELALAVYQVRAMCKHFKSVLNDADVGGLVLERA
jgi:hypothetical protein